MLILMLVLMAMAVLSPQGVMAQGSDTIPASIYEGTCDDLGSIAFTLPDLAAGSRPEASPVPAVEHMGSDSAQPVLMSRTELDVLISALYEEDHAVAMSRIAGGQIIACGDVGGPMELQMAGMVMPGDQLVVGVGEREGSGYAGIALLTTEGLSTTVTLYLLTESPQT